MGTELTYENDNDDDMVVNEASLYQMKDKRGRLVPSGMREPAVNANSNP